MGVFWACPQQGSGEGMGSGDFRQAKGRDGAAYVMPGWVGRTASVV